MSPGPLRWLALLAALRAADAIEAVALTARQGFLRSTTPLLRAEKKRDEASVGQQGRRFISVADLHGDYGHAFDLLHSLNVTDKSGRWAGGRDVLVQTGDVCDRGNHSKKLYEMLFRLQDEAKTAGGEVILLLGNHELLRMQGDTRYATDGDFDEFGGAPASDAAFGPHGWLGQRLRERGQIAALLGPDYGLEKPTLYVHAGLLPSVLHSLSPGASFAEIRSQPGSALGGTDGYAAGVELVRSLNVAARKHLVQKTEEELREDQTALFGDAGPLWTRHLALDGDVCGDLQETLDALRATRMVVGHTVQDDGRIHTRCSGKLVLADTMISDAYTGTSHPSALEITADGLATALYPTKGSREKLP